MPVSVVSGTRLFGHSFADLALGALAFSGGASSSNSPSLRIPRTGSANIGASAFTIEMMLAPSATANDNNRTISEGAAYVDAATHGNIIWDADVLEANGFILGLSAGRLYLGVNNSGGARTIVGSTDHRTGSFHHCFWYFDPETGLMRLGADGVREDSFNGPAGSVAYAGGGVTTDGYHYLAKEKLNMTYGFNGRVAMIRVTLGQLYPDETYDVPSLPLPNLAGTVMRYLLTEGEGTAVADSSGEGNHGQLVGSPLPSWVSGP